jgi:predicted phosphodiesterase
LSYARVPTTIRVALFSDVHGNAVAFDAVLDDFAQTKVDKVVCLGDHAQGGPQPGESLELLRELGCPAVMGNSDHFLLTLDPGPEEKTEQEIENTRWGQAGLSEELLAFQRSFQPSVEIDLGGGRTLLAFHGTPRSRDADVGPWMDEADFRAHFDGLHAAVFAGGHSHQQWARRLGDSYYINPGSVGLPLDHHRSESPPRADSHAEYAILTAKELGIGVEFRRIPFDVDQLLDAAQTSGMPHPHDVADHWPR